MKQPVRHTKSHAATRARNAPRRRLSAGLMTALLLVPTLLAVTPTGHSDNVTFALGNVEWQNAQALKTVLHFKGGSTADGPVHTMDTSPPHRTDEQVSDPRRTAERTPKTTPYGITGSDAPMNPVTRTAIIRSVPLTHDVNVTGNNALFVRWHGTFPEELTWTLTIRSDGGATAGTITITDIVDPSSGNRASGDPCLARDPFSRCSVTVPLSNADGRFAFREGRAITVEISAAGESATGTPTTWSLRTQDVSNPSFLEIYAENVIKVAAWTADHDGNVKSFFRPRSGRDVVNRLDGFFSVKSAFGAGDLGCSRETGAVQCGRGFEPIAQILDRNQSVTRVGPQNLTTIVLRSDSTGNSTLEQGVVTYRFPSELWDYSRYPFPTGSFTLVASTRIRGDDNLQQGGSLTASWPFVISTQTITLRPYDDGRNPSSPLESGSHEVAAGGTTTFLILARNGANFSDNITITPKLVSSQPAFGWSARLGGDSLVGGSRLPIGPGEEKLFTVTVTAPADAVASQSAVFVLTARSSVDLTTEAAPYSLIATVSENVREGVGLVVPNPVERVRPGIDNLVQAFLWNQGTRPANLTVTLRAQETPGWNVTLLQHNLETNVLTVPNVPAGDLSPVVVRVRPDSSLTVGAERNVTLNATLGRVGGPGEDQDVIFRLVSLASFRVDLLGGIKADAHHLEMSCQSPSIGCRPGFGGNGPDGVSSIQDWIPGTWFRAWITNTGDLADTYQLSLTNMDERDSSGDRADAFSKTPPDFSVGVRSPTGKFAPRSSITIAPGQTGEVYVWVGHDNNSATAPSSTFTFDLAVRSQLTKQVIHRTAKAIGEDAELSSSVDRKTAVKLEHVERDRNWIEGRGEPLVNVANAGRSSIRKFIDLSGSPQYFYVRVTNGASWKTYMDENDNERRSDVLLALSGVDEARRNGWNFSMRPRNGVTDETKNPWMETLSVSNRAVENARWEGFFDQEIEVRVLPPQDGSGTVTAQEAKAVTLRAKLPGNTGTAADEEIEMVVEVARLPNVTMRAERLREFVTPGGQTAFVLYVANNGSEAAPASITARVTDDTPRASLWSVTQQNLNLSAHENITTAIVVNAPLDAGVGDPAVINVTLSYPKFPRDPDSERVERFVTLTAEVRPRSNLELTPVPPVMQVTPGQLANFTMEIRNTGSSDVNYQVQTTPIPNWTASPIPNTRVLAGQSTRFAYILEVPNTVIQGRTYQSVVKVSEVGNPDNFDLKVVTVNIVGGHPFPIVQAVRSQDLIQRDGVARFEVGVKNLGNTAGTFPLEANVIRDSRWEAWVEDASGTVITSVRVNPNELVPVFLVARAPREVAEGTSMPVTLRAFNSAFDRSSAATVRALVQDYAVDVEVRPGRLDIVAGDVAELTVRVTNLGNGNDTFDLEADLMGLGGWDVEFGATQVSLLPGASTDVRAVVRSPSEPLPTPRTYTMSVLAGSVGGAGVALPRNDSAPLLVTVFGYRAFDVDGDGFVELAIDMNKRASDGYEFFREIHREGDLVRAVDNLSGKQDGKIAFLLDVPQDGGYDGVADLYFDPDGLFVYAIEFTPDINGDATPEYLLDTDNDGIVDAAWDTTTRSLWGVTMIHAFGGNEPQFLVDTNGDSVPDRYYDPARRIVTRTIPEGDRIGLDTDGSGKTNKLYNIESGTVTDASVQSLNAFVREFWYFFVMFALVLAMFGLVLARRRRGP